MGVSPTVYVCVCVWCGGGGEWGGGVVVKPVALESNQLGLASY